jgi:hypothetical protein
MQTDSPLSRSGSDHDNLSMNELAQLLLPADAEMHDLDLFRRCLARLLGRLVAIDLTADELPS